ncbi:MAG: hypothetical protein KDA89_13235 [Planctomycetaceae bacterium]|nr:hypothetical protein [Planctomycetaceae bacterium]
MSNVPVRLGVLLLTVGALTGCGGADRPSLVSVKGKITLNGAPLEGALIAMQLDPPDPQYKRPAQARSNAQGEYIPATYGDAEGVPVGKYRVAVVKQEIPEGYNTETPEANTTPVKYITPFRYSDADTSGITVEVTSAGLSPEVIALEGEPEMIGSGGQRRGGNDP